MPSNYSDPLMNKTTNCFLGKHIYLPGTQMTPIFEGQPLKTRPFRIKRRVIWVYSSVAHTTPTQHPPKKRKKSLESKLLAGSRYWHRQTLGRRGLLLPIHPVILGCPRKLGSMVSKWVISPTYKWDILGL